MLSDAEIKRRVLKDELIEKKDYDENHARFCGYELRLGKVFNPKSGEMESAPVAAPGKKKRRIERKSVVWTIGPSETLVVETKETVRIPDDLCATYGQLNRRAREGLMLVNASTVEPGYCGPLSCVLVNFSSERISLRQDCEIAKIGFHTLDGKPDNKQKAEDPKRYEALLAESATKLPKSFLDITGVEERVTQKMRSVIKQGVAFASIVIVILLLWSQLEPLFSHWLWTRTGLMSTSTQIELERRDLQFQRRFLAVEAENQQLQIKITDLEREIESLRE